MAGRARSVVTATAIAARAAIGFLGCGIHHCRRGDYSVVIGIGILGAGGVRDCNSRLRGIRGGFVTQCGGPSAVYIVVCFVDVWRYICVAV